MTKGAILAIDEPNLSAAWARAFRAALDSADHEISPFLASITMREDGLPAEDHDLRDALDACLEKAGHLTIEKVAKSLFPQAVWARCKGDRQELYKYYLRYLPDYVAMEPDKNRHGTYFGRLVGYTTDPRTGNREAHLPATLRHGDNQLEFIIAHCCKGKRRAMLQAAVYDPVRDQTGAALQGFPCLQQVSFVPDFRQNTLSLNAFYATQQLFVKAYGNWLGLCRLGTFVASQTNLRFVRLSCFAGIQKMDDRPKSGDLLDRLKDLAAATAGVPTRE